MVQKSKSSNFHNKEYKYPRKSLPDMSLEEQDDFWKDLEEEN